MLYQDNEYKFTAILNRKIPRGKLMNALSHITWGLASQEFDQPVMYDYHDADTTLHASLAVSPFIVLQAKNSNQIASVAKQCRELSIVYQDFVHTMVASSLEEQLKKTNESSSDELDYRAIILYGRAEKTSSITKKFSLRKED